MRNDGVVARQIPLPALLIFAILLLYLPLRQDIPNLVSNVLLYGATALLGVILLLSSKIGSPLRKESKALCAVIAVYGVYSLARGYHSTDFFLVQGELLRLVSGISIFFITYLHRDLKRLYLILGTTFLAVLFAILNLSSLATSGGVFSGIGFNVLASHEDMGALYLLILPVLLSIVLNIKGTSPVKLVCFACFIFLSLAILLTRCRSSIFGFAFALVFLFVFTVLDQKQKRDQSNADRHDLLPAIFILLSIGVFFLFYGISMEYFLRGSKLGELLSTEGLHGRQQLWTSASLMWAERPLWGWGLGSFVALGGQWNHFGWDLPTIRHNGFYHYNIAHGYSLQWAADTGIVGLFLHIWIVFYFILKFTQVFRSKESGLKDDLLLYRAILLGIGASLIGGFIDSFGNAAYNFHGLTALWWMFAAIGLSISDHLVRQDTANPSLQGRFERGYLLGGAIAAATLCLCVGVYGLSLKSWGARQPRGKFWLQQVPTTRPGEVKIAARFEDARRQDQITQPGTVWEVDTQKLLRLPMQSMYKGSQTEREEDRYAKFALTPRQGDVVEVRASYRDEKGNLYRTTMRVVPPPPQKQVPKEGESRK